MQSRLVALVFALGLVAVACRTQLLPDAGAQPAVDLGARDLAVPVDATAPRDLTAPGPDLTFTVGVVCGPVRCASDVGQYCDTGDDGVSGTCRPPTASPTNTPFQCDGAEDCSGGVCCLTPNGSACSSVGFCVAGDVKGLWMCHSTEECGAGFFCCPLTAGAPYQACVQTPC